MSSRRRCSSAGAEEAGEAFAKLCSLSVVRAGEHGLMLHDDVRRVLVDDLRWRNPERFARLRDGALAYLRARSLREYASDVEGIRDLICRTIEGLHSDEDLALALRAVELAYIQRAASHERLAERLAVSRSTFYRLLRRGVRAIAESLGRA